MFLLPFYIVEQNGKVIMVVDRVVNKSVKTS